MSFNNQKSGKAMINIFSILLLIAAFSFPVASCYATEADQNNNQNYVVKEGQSPKPGYLIALEKGDYKTAIKEMRSLAEKGDLYVQYNLGLLYYRGTAGLTQNYKEAEKLWRKSAEKGLIAAGSGLAQIYQTGKETDRQESFEWYRKAAKRNMVFAYYFLGCFYGEGYGVEKDYQESAKWFRKAVDNGYFSAPLNLGMMYQNGRGVPRDYQEAFKLYRMAAAQDVVNAQVLLGTMYFKGEGVAQDYVQAYKWFYIASANSDNRFADVAQKGI